MKCPTAARLLVLGGGNAAGVGHFRLARAEQMESFVALMASSGRYRCPLPLIGAPGISIVPGQPVIAPADSAMAFFGSHRGGHPWGNFSAPWSRFSDFLARPEPPVAISGGYRASLVLDAMLACHASPDGAKSRIHQYIELYRPDSVLIELGAAEAFDFLSAAPESLEGLEKELLAQSGELLDTVSRHCDDIAILTVPDPTLLPYFQDCAALNELCTIDGQPLGRALNLDPGALAPLTLILAGDPDGARWQPPLFASAFDVITAERRVIARQSVARINAGVAELARQRGARLIDFAALVGEIAAECRASASYFLGEGHFGLSGVFLGPAGHWRLAQAILGEHVPAQVAGEFAIRSASDSRRESIEGYRARKGSREYEYPIQSLYPALDVFERQWMSRPIPGVPAGGLGPAHTDSAVELPFEREIRLRVNPKRSAFGDVIEAADSDEVSKNFGLPAGAFDAAPLFDGALMTAGALGGEIVVRFSETYVSGWSSETVRFELDHGAGLLSSEASLSAPILYTLPNRDGAVRNAPSLPLSSGELCLATGQTRNFHYNVEFFNSAIDLLLEVNPKVRLPTLAFPGFPGSGHSAIRFSNRPDGSLDLELTASAFIPLGKSQVGQPVRLPLPLRGPGGHPLAISARGSSLHPWIYIASGEDIEPLDPVAAPGGVREYVINAGSSAFGDDFKVELEPLGGSALAQSPVSGRITAQFGRPVDNLVPIAIKLLPPLGWNEADNPLLPYLPGGSRLGLVGYDRDLQFPRARFQQRGLGLVSDPFKLGIGLLDTRSGRIALIALRGLITQQFFLDLLKCEPAIPRDSFIFLGNGTLAGSLGESLRLEGGLMIPYPAGQNFPAPANGDSYRLETDGELHPFFSLDARIGGDPSSQTLHLANISCDNGEEVDLAFVCAPDGKVSFRLDFPHRSRAYELTRLVSLRSLRATKAETGAAWQLAGIARLDNRGKKSEVRINVEFGHDGVDGFVAFGASGGFIDSLFGRGYVFHG